LIQDNGFVVPWGEPVALADAMEGFLREPDVCQQMGQKSQEISRRFSWQVTAQAYLDLSSEVVTDSSAV
jgi:glycosyltransferase involved in cell wall biosynthesis